MEQKELDDYWSFFNNELKALPEIYQRKVALAFCSLIKGELNDLGLHAYSVVEDLAVGKKYRLDFEKLQKKLQALLPADSPSPYSVLIWSLMPNTPSYPPYYAAGIAGLNIADLQISTLRELSELARKTVLIV